MIDSSRKLWPWTVRLTGLAVWIACAPLAASLLAAPSAPATRTTQPARLEGVPDEEAQKTALSGIRSIYLADYRRTSPADQIALARRMLAVAQDTHEDPAGKYELIAEARRLAIATGDVKTALASVECAAGSFVIDRATWQMTTLEALSRRDTLEGDDAKYLCDAWAEIADSAFGAEDYALLTRAIERGLGAARAGHDQFYIAEAAARFRRWQETAREYDRIKLLYAHHQADATDIEAATAVGRFECFFREDWARGLALLAHGNDAALRALAEHDLATEPTVNARTRIADEWWDYAEQQPPRFKAVARNRAGEWYQLALPNLTGLARERVVRRIDSISTGKVIDLLALVDFSRPVVGYEKTSGRIVSRKVPTNILMLPYVPPEEYDFQVDFTSETPSPWLKQIAWKDNHDFAWVMGDSGGSIAGFECVKGMPLVHNPTTTSKGMPLVAGHRMTCTLQVRADGMTVILDGQKISSYKTDYKDISGVMGWRDAHLGIETHNSVITFHSIRLVEISGAGHRAK